MFSSLDFLQSRQITKYNTYKKLTDNVDKLQIPVVHYEGQEEPSEENLEFDSLEEEEITEDEIILFGTINSEEFSCLAVFASDGNESYCHHDIIIPNTIINSCHIGNDLIALATFSNDVLVYDAFLKTPDAPSAILDTNNELSNIFFNNNTLSASNSTFITS